MRMEDLDPERSRAEYAQAALDDLHWLGLEWDEGPDVGGAFGPYQQSRRGNIYFSAWRRLLEGGFIYPCACSRKDLAAALSAPHEASAVPAQAEPGRGAPVPDLDDEPIYPGTCRSLALHAAEFSSGAGDTHWRFRVPDGETIEFVDENMGPQRFVAGVEFGDFLVWRRDMSPRARRTDSRPWGVSSYQLACVADDAAMRITEVVRGADLLKSTARQILLNRALGFADPKWFHCELSVDEQGRRLAKRHDALSLRALRERGLLPAEIIAGTAHRA